MRPAPRRYSLDFNFSTETRRNNMGRRRVSRTRPRPTGRSLILKTPRFVATSVRHSALPDGALRLRYLTSVWVPPRAHDTVSIDRGVRAWPAAEERDDARSVARNVGCGRRSATASNPALRPAQTHRPLGRCFRLRAAKRAPASAPSQVSSPFHPRSVKLCGHAQLIGVPHPFPIGAP